MNEVPLFVGIDVSKDRLDVAARPAGEAWQVPHDPQGINSLTERLREVAPRLVVVEATGGMEMAGLKGRWGISSPLAAWPLRRSSILELGHDLLCEHVQAAHDLFEG